MFLNIGQSMSFWPHDTCICFQAVCLEIIWYDPREYCKFFLFINSLQNLQNILFSLPSNLSHLYFPSMPPSNLHVFFGENRCSRCCVNFFIIWWLLSSKERVQWALHLFPLQHTLAHVLIHQRKTDKDLWNEITKATILYPTVHFVSWVEPRLLFSTYSFHFLKGLTLAILCLFQGPFSAFWYHTKKITCMYFSESNNFTCPED